MQVSFYGKTFTFNNEEQLIKAEDDIYYYAQDKKKQIEREFDEKKDRALDKLERDSEEMFRKLRDLRGSFKNSKGQDMNYYAKLAKEKKNSNFFLERLKAKSFRSADELERAIKSYVAGGRVISDDADGFTVEAIDDDGKHTYKIYLREDGGTSERVTVEKVVKLNSKGEDMNYYEKIIQEKKNDSKEEKDNANFHYLGRSWWVTEGNYKEVRKQIEQAYKDKVADLERKISRSTGTEEHRYKEELRELKGNHRESMESFDWGYGNSKSYYQSIIEKKNALPEFKYCYQAMQWFKEGGQYAEVIDKLVDRFHLDKSTAAAAAQKGQQMYEDSYRSKR